MKIILRILIIEDYEDDALLLVHQIKKSGYNIEYKRIQTREEMRSAITTEKWDLILSDYQLPEFNGFEALAILKNLNIDIPFIIISGVIGEEQAVQAMKLGAHDYLMKNKLERLVPAIERELREASNREENQLLRKKQEQAETLRLSEEKLKNLIADMHVGVLLLNSQGNLQLINNKALELLELTEDQLTGKRSIPKDWVAKYEDGSAFPGFPSIFKQFPISCQPVRNMMIEVFRPMKGNSAWIMVDAVPQFEIDGKIQQVVWTFVDRTERKNAIEALRKNEERYRSMVEMSPDAIVIHQNNRVVYINPSGIRQLNAKSKEEVIGKSIFEFIHPDSINIVKNNLSLTKEGLAVPYTEEKFINLNGEIIDVEVSAIPTTFYEEDATQVIVRNISKRKKAEEEIKVKTKELTKLNQEKDKFFSIIAHDLRSPISSLRGITEILAENIQKFSMDKLQDIFVELKDSANNLYQLMENLLQWGKNQLGISSYNPEKINLSETIHQSIAVYSDLAGKKGIHIEYNIPENMFAFVDKNMFQLIIRNLVSNAIKFTEREGRVTINVRKVSENNLEVEIQDTGIGMDKEMLNDLFKLNAPVNRPGTEGEPSSGLGLILCKEYIKKNGGEIRVSSQVGKGTSFFFSLKEVK